MTKAKNLTKGEIMKIELVVTRHQALVDYLLELGLAGPSTEVIAHATVEAVAGKHVCGVLPHSLSRHTAQYTEVPLGLPAELRGQELTLEQVRQFAGNPVTYIVSVATGHDCCPVCGYGDLGGWELEGAGFSKWVSTCKRCQHSWLAD